MNKLFGMVAAVAFGLLAASMWLPNGAVAQSTPAGDAARGKAALLANGCYECHGTQGQGNPSAGPAIAPHPIDLRNFLAYIRAPRGDMPPYSAKILPDATAADIHAYLSSVAATKSPDDIALLKDVSTGNAGPAPVLSDTLAHGRAVYTTNCVKCHVSAPIGPTLVNIKARLDLDKTIAYIKNPSPRMTKFYPGTLSDKDVADVAAYVQSL